MDKDKKKKLVIGGVAAAGVGYVLLTRKTGDGAVSDTFGSISAIPGDIVDTFSSEGETGEAKDAGQTISDIIEMLPGSFGVPSIGENPPSVQQLMQEPITTSKKALTTGADDTGVAGVGNLLTYPIMKPVQMLGGTTAKLTK